VLTLIESISLAGDRKKQNDDIAGTHGAFAWVIDGATDLLDAPIMPAASDAAWIAQALNDHIYRNAAALKADETKLRDVLRGAAAAVANEFAGHGKADERWKSPTASVLMASETVDGLIGLDLGDCRCFTFDADGTAQVAGSRGSATDDEQARARDATKRAGATALLRDPDTMTMLRAVRAKHNLPEHDYWVFGLQPECADHARAWTLPLKRPAHVLLCTDGLSALVDRYRVCDAGGLVRAALDKGLQELGRELRAIETADSGGAAHPRFKKSDDATGLLLRLS
jgi:serine/threonine protein phosphatase PrpC